MPCPLCGSEYKSIGDSRVCSKCGHVAGYKQVNIVDIINQLEACHRQQEYFINELGRIKKNGVYISPKTWEYDIQTLVFRLRNPEPREPAKGCWLYCVPDE